SLRTRRRRAGRHEASGGFREGARRWQRSIPRRSRRQQWFSHLGARDAGIPGSAGVARGAPCLDCEPGFRRSSERDFLLATLAGGLASRCDLVLGHLTVVVGGELVEALGGASLAGTGHLVECQDAIAVLVQLLERRTVMVAVVGKGARGREEGRGTEHRDNELPHG